MAKGKDSKNLSDLVGEWVSAEVFNRREDVRAGTLVGVDDKGITIETESRGKIKTACIPHGKYWLETSTAAETVE